MNLNQDNWVEQLPIAQVAINDSASETTRETPFFSNYGKDPNLFMEPQQGPATEKALTKASDLKKVHKKLKERIEKSKKTLVKTRYKDSKTAPQLEEGSKVYLLTKNLKTKRGTKKLDHVKVGPFLVKRKKGELNYELDLPKDARIHPVFHISLLEPAHPDNPLQTTFHYKP